MQGAYNLRKSLVSKAICFLDKTKVYAIQGINPGGIYQALWCRDAAYILRDWFLSGVDFDQIIRHIVLIWSHQIIPGHEKVIYGRGSPRTKFLYSVANSQIEKSFEGALPTTIFSSGFCEVYGINPDIDSNALMISTTSWILYRYLEDNEVLSESQSQHAAASRCADLSSSDYDLKTITQYISRSRCSSSVSNQLESTIDFVLPRMLKSANYLLGRDLDDDGLLEQDYNEDWMDTILRSGKIVYSQASWILALKHLSLLLRKLGNHTKACKLEQLSYKVTNAIEQKLWSEQRKCHADVQDIILAITDKHTSFLTQDVLLYTVAITEGTANNVYKVADHGESNFVLNRSSLSVDQNLLYSRADSTLNSLRDILWQNGWPMVIEYALSRTGPKFLKAYQYHNYTFWPWMTGIEILARSRFKRFKECDLLLSKLTSDDNPYIYSFYEWVNPVTAKGDGAYPFRTGISAIRMAIFEILNGMICNL